MSLLQECQQQQKSIESLRDKSVSLLKLRVLQRTENNALRNSVFYIGMRTTP